MRKLLKDPKIRILSLLLLLATSLGIGIYFSTDSPHNVIFAENSLYHIKGKNNNCLWVINIKEKVTTEPGSTSVAFIGIPSSQNDGAIAATVQVTPYNVLLAFNIPSGNKYRLPPVVLTTDLKKIEYPVEYMRFTWMRSDVFTMRLYKDLNSCVNRGADKDDG